ncbi:S24 family peptidase [Bartonella sp. DGB2]|uniref:S24 family peptidase n=1 Tax=Bartonella sp. DGB2 TaxID=3388426 RepID=UPI0039901048
MGKLKKIIEERLRIAGMGPVEAAVQVGLERGFIRDFLVGRKKTFRPDKLDLLSRALRMDIRELMVYIQEDARAASAGRTENRSIERIALTQKGAIPQGVEACLSHNFSEPANGSFLGPVNFNQTAMIPVYGQAVAGEDGQFILNGNFLYSALCPPQLSSTNGAYGVEVSGDSMEPRYSDREIVYVDPKRRVVRGDYVVAQILIDEHSAPHAYVKRFVSHNAKELVLEQFNPVKQLRFPHARVVSVHYIALAGTAPQG